MLHGQHDKAEQHRLLSEAMEAQHLSPAELADLIEADPSLVSRYVAGKTYLEAPAFMRLTNALRTLSPVALVQALGYQVVVPGSDRLPRQLVVDLLSLPKPALDDVASLVSRLAHPGSSPGERS